MEGLNIAIGIGSISYGYSQHNIIYDNFFVVGKKQYITMSGKSTRPNIVELGKWRWPITGLVSTLSFIGVILPFATVAVTSFTINMGKPVSFKYVLKCMAESIYERFHHRKLY